MLTVISLVNKLRSDQDKIKTQLVDQGPVEAEVYRSLVLKWQTYQEVLDFLTAGEEDE